PEGFNKGTYELGNIERSFETSPSQLADWNGYGSGYSLDATVRHGGDRSLSCESKGAGNERGASQHVLIGQAAPAPLLLSGWSKAEGVTGEKDNSYCVYADLVLSDGSNLWGQVAAFDVGTHDWQRGEAMIRSEKAVRSATLHCLFRDNHTGKVWFDDLYLGPTDSKNNLLKTPDFESVSNVRPVLDGTYIDSLEGWSNVKNFNSEHFTVADIPLTFDPQSKKPMILTITSTYEFAKELHDRMRAKGKLMMANAMLHGYSFFAWLMDVMGTETNWNPGNHWQPMSDAELLFKRSLCYQKPYCFLQNTHFEDFTYALTEKYMQRCLFYGMFPGFFSENAATDHYFENPKWYNATRPLFKRYVPLIQEVAAAGWQPVTYAAADQETVLVECYGVPGKKLYLAVLNDSSQSREVTVSIEAKPLALTKEGVKDMVAGGVPTITRKAGKWQLKDQLKAEEVRLYRVE
ncbi:MAG: hypothetical protein HY318_10065, partial [Armatimonadetes bacterium]|nr:hypothetical protein [Armatimonadota bacterium]